MGDTPPRRLTAAVELLGWRRRKEQRAVTRGGDEKAWKEFVSWCQARGLRAMPANPWTLASYARWCEGRHRLPAIARTFKAIARVHGSKSRRRPERHPTVTHTLNLIKTRANAKTRAKARGKGRAAACFGGPSGDLTERALTPVMRAVMEVERGEFVPGQGALPIHRGGELIGAVGGSGGTAQEDEDAARAGIAAL